MNASSRHFKCDPAKISRCLAAGMSQKQIAERLGASQASVSKAISLHRIENPNAGRRVYSVGEPAHVFGVVRGSQWQRSWVEHTFGGVTA